MYMCVCCDFQWFIIMMTDGIQLASHDDLPLMNSSSFFSGDSSSSSSSISFLPRPPIFSAMHLLFPKRTLSSPSSPSSSSSTSLPTSPTAGGDGNNNRGHLSANKKTLTRLRKIRHLTDKELGLQDIIPGRLDSPPGSPPGSGGRKPRSFGGSSDHWSCTAVPKPLPLPDSLLTKRPEQSSPEQGPGRKSVDHPGNPPAKPSGNNCSRRFAQGGANIERADGDCPLRLNIAARSAPASGFSSPSVSPRRSPDPGPSTTCRRRRSDDLNGDCSCTKSSWIASPSSAPTSGFCTQAFGPQRSNAVDLLPSFMSPQEFHFQSSSQFKPLKTVRSADHSPVDSPRLHSTLPPPAICKERPEGSNGGSSSSHGAGSAGGTAHPLPLPPRAEPPSQSFMASHSPAVVHHHSPERLNVWLRKPQWQKGRLIGRGTFGSVYVGTDRITGAYCAIKEVDIIHDDPKSAECVKQLQQEISILQTRRHPNIVQYYGSEIVDDSFYIYLEYVHPGSLNKYVREHCGHMTESIVRNFTRHILSGLDYLHSTKTIHRDIKGANLLVDSSGTVKLADFGMAKHLIGCSYQLSLKGSPHWMAPEVIKAMMQNDASPDLALAVDIWSLGCTVIEMFTGQPPWGELHGPQAMFKVLYRDPPIPEKLSPEGKDFLSCCFQRDPAHRPSAAKLLDHPFVRPNGCRQSLSALNLMSSVDKSQSCRDCSTHKIPSMPTSPPTRIINHKLPSNSENGDNICGQMLNWGAASQLSPRSTLEVLPFVSTTQPVRDPRRFSSSSNVSSYMPVSASNNHSLALQRSHGTEVPHV